MRWLLRRLGQALATLVVATTILFFLVRLVPGDPVAAIVGERPVSQEELHNLRERYGLDRSLPGQFASFISDLARFDLGRSIQYQGLPVTTLIRQRLPASLLLGGTVLLINFTLGLALGAWQAVRKGSWADRILGVVSLAAYSIPSFWLGLVLAWLVAVKWGVLPAAGTLDPLLAPDAPWITRALDVGRHLILPALTLSIVTIGAAMRFQRNAMIEVLQLDYIRTARAKGVPEGQVLRRHAWRNALFPVITLFGLWLPLLATGAVFVESVFHWTGLGLLAADAVSARDYPVLVGTGMLVAVLVVSANLLTDLAYMALDPRVRTS